ncbi:MAG: 2-oxoacid:ferredoxin oxidoreductase subunit beta, partial [Pseudomonadota bacterium]
IYGLTKGQYSPTSKPGLKTPSTPVGSVDRPLSATQFALGSGARFVARTVDVMQKHMPGVLKRAHEHAGASFVEIFQNCIVYNDAVFSHFTDKAVASDAQVHVEHGKPLLFGKENNKGLRLNMSTLKLETVTIGKNGISESDILVHDETNHTLATMLTAMEAPEMPVALGVLYCNPAPTYDAEVTKQVEQFKAAKPNPDLNALFREGHTWTIK